MVLLNFDLSPALTFFPAPQVITCFFIDTAHNVLEYLELIAKLLRRPSESPRGRGGVWLHLGPLHYVHEQAHCLRLTWEELRGAAEAMGFRFLHQEVRTCKYKQPPNTLLPSEYRCIHSAAVVVR